MYNLLLKIKKISLVLVVFFLSVFAGTAFADDQSGQVIQLQNPLPVNDPASLIGLLINTFLGLSGSIALIVFIAGGITWLTSEGEASKIKKGLDSMIWAAIGMAVIFGSAAVVRFVLSTLTNVSFK